MTLGRIARVGAFLALQALLVLALLELVARVFDPLGVSYYPETARFLDALILEEPIGYRMPPKLAARFHGVPVETSSLGLRDRELPADRPPGERRVMVLGDSVVFGIGVPFEDTIVHQLEEVLNESAPPGRRYRTLNMGVPSYNTGQELMQLEDLGPKLEPDVVVLIFTANDIEPKKWVFEKRSRWYQDWAQRSYAVSLLFTGLSQLRARLGSAPQGIAVQNFAAANPRWLAVSEALEGIDAWCDARGIPLVVFTLVGTQDIQDLLEAEGRKGSFQVLRLSPWSDPRWAGKTAADYRNSVVDSHSNREGSRIQALWLGEVLARLGVLEPAP